MDLQVLDANYMPQTVLDSYLACVWTEQYTNVGGFELVVPATKYFYDLLAPGVHISNSKSAEVGTILTRQVKDNKIIVKGPFLLGLLKYRVFRAGFNHEQTTIQRTGSPGGLLWELLAYSILYGGPDGNGSGGPGGSANVAPLPDTTNNVIRNFEIVSIDGSGAFEAYTPNFGSLLTEMLKIAQSGQIGIELILSRPTPTTYSLGFRAYYGVDRSNEVIFSPALDNLAESEEIHSLADFYNVCYAFAPGVTAEEIGGTYVVGLADLSGSNFDWDRRVMSINVDGIEFGVDFSGWAELQNILNKAALDALFNHNYVRLVDGEIVPQIGYMYGSSYKVGDIIGLESQFGNRQKARVVEFIRSQDASGYKEYPTLSVVD